MKAFVAVFVAVLASAANAGYVSTPVAYATVPAAQSYQYQYRYATPAIQPLYVAQPAPLVQVAQPVFKTFQVPAVKTIEIVKQPQIVQPAIVKSVQIAQPAIVKSVPAYAYSPYAYGFGSYLLKK